MKRFVSAIAGLMVAGMAFAAFAAETAKGKVASVEGTNVTVNLSGAAPAWLKPGATVKARGGAPSVVSIKGQSVILKFGKAKAAKIKADTDMTISEAAGEELQGC